jgi:phytanoyl-CoA hydroxylase
LKHSNIKKKITKENKAFYSEKGYLTAQNLFSNEEINELKKELVTIFRKKGESIIGYVRPEEGVSDDDLIKSYTTLNFPHKASDVITGYVKHPKVAGILSQIISPNVKCMQSMLFMKGPGKKGQSWHQDEYYIPTRDRSLTGCWIAIDDATIENGCLWVIPGSHKSGHIRKRIAIEREEFQDKDMSDLSPFVEEKDAIPVELEAGSVLFFNGYLLHGSLNNKSNDSYRRSLVNHYMSAESILTWSWDGSDPIPEDHRDIVMVAGEDPYAYKGLAEISKPILRPDVLDGKTKWY